MDDEGEKSLELQAQMEGLFNKLGVSVYNANGELKNTYEILGTLAEVYPKLTTEEKAYVTETIAGKHQAQNAAAILNNWKTAVEATATAMNSQGSAAKENERVLDSIQGHLQRLKSAWEELSQTVVNSDFVKAVISLGTTITKILTGAFKVMNTMSLDSVFGILTKIFNLISNIFDITTEIGNAIDDAGIIKILSYIINPLNMVNDLLDAMLEKTKDYNDVLKDTKNISIDYYQTLQELGDVEQKLKELSPVDIVSEKQIIKLKEEKKILEEELEILKKQKEEADKKLAQEAKRKALSLTNFTGVENPLYSSATSPTTKAGQIPTFDKNAGQNIQGYNKELGEAIDKSKNLHEYQTMTIKTVDDLIKYYGLLTTEIENAKNADGDYSNVSKDVVKQQKESRDLLLDLAGRYQEAMNLEGLSNLELTEMGLTYYRIMKVLYPTNAQVQVLNTLLSRTDDTTKAFNAELYKLNSVGKLNKETLKALLSEEGYKGLVDLFNAIGIDLDVIIEKFNDLAPTVEKNSTLAGITDAKFKELHDSVVSLVSEIDALNDALLEQAQNGKISIDTALDLIDKGYAAAISFDEQTGALKLNAKAAKELALAKLELKKVNITESINKTIAALQKEGEAVGIDIDAYVDKLKAMDASSLSNNQRQILNLYAERSAVTAVTKAYQKLGTSSWKGSSGRTSSKSTKSWWEKQLETLKEQYSNSEITIEEYIKALEKLLGKLKKGSDAWKQVNKLLQEQRLSKIESDYKRGVISLDEYIKKLQELIKTYKQGTKAWQDLADKIKEGLLDKAKQEQKDYEDAAKAATSIIDDEIKRLEELKDAKQKANDETEKELELAKLQEALEKARNERTKRVFVEGKGWTYVQDEQAIKEAQDALDNFNKEQETDEIDKQIEALEKYKEAWSNVSSDYEKEQQKLLLAQQFGADAEEKILNKRLDILEEYRKKYLETLKQISDLEKKTAEEILGTTTGTSAGNGGGTGASGQAGLVSSIKAVFGRGRKNKKNDIKALQQALIALGYSLPKYGADGKWGSETLRALKKFQKDNGLKADGIVGKNTKRAFAKKGYANGGVVDYTGYAMVHGSVNYPEVMLNNRQASKLYSMLSHPTYNRVGNTSNTTQVYNFDKLVLPNVKNANQFLSELKALVNITKNN